MNDVQWIGTVFKGVDKNSPEDSLMMRFTVGFFLTLLLVPTVDHVPKRRLNRLRIQRTWRFAVSTKRRRIDFLLAAEHMPEQHINQGFKDWLLRWHEIEGEMKGLPETISISPLNREKISSCSSKTPASDWFLQMAGGNMNTKDYELAGDSFSANLLTLLLIEFQAG